MQPLSSPTVETYSLLKQARHVYGLLVEIAEYSFTETPAQYLWAVRLQIPQVTGSSTPEATSEEQIVQGGPGGQAAEPAFPLAFVDFGGITKPLTTVRTQFLHSICASLYRVSC